MKNIAYAIIALLALAVAGYFYMHFYVSTPPAKSDVVSGNQPEITQQANSAPLSIEAAQSLIVGSWRRSDKAQVRSFAAGGTLTDVAGGNTLTGSWQLFTSMNPPADLAHLVLESGRVFLRIVESTTTDYFLESVDQKTLKLDYLGKPGPFSYTRI